VRISQQSTPPFSLRQQRKFSIASIGGRFVSYLVDIVVIGCITTLVLAPFQISPVLFVGSFLYFQGVGKLSLLSYHDVAVTSISFIVLATIYFFIEAFLNLSVGKPLMRQKIVMLKGFSTPRRRFLGALERAIIKAIPPINVIDSLFILKHRRLSQRLTDIRNGLVVIQKKRPFWGNFLAVSAILYYFPLIAMTLRSSLFLTLPLQPSNTTTDTTLLRENLLNQIVTNNLSLGFQLLLGGVVLSSLSILIVLSSSLIEGVVLGHILLSQPSFIFYRVLPHFFFETVGYVLEIGGSLIVSTIILDWLEGYVKRKPIGIIVGEIGEKLKYLLTFSVISVILILLGAIVETSLLPSI
jgi:hypothetical protein